MSMFTLAISCLTTSSLLWFMDLITFQVPMQYCSLQHQALLSSPVTSTTGCCFRFWISLFILSFVSVLMAQMVKCLPTMQETLVQLLGWEDPLEKKMTTHFSTLAWKIPRREEPSRLHGVAKSRTWLSDFIFLSFFILSGGISPLFSSSILGAYRPGEFIFWCHIFLPFHTVLGVLKARMLKWFAIPFSSRPRFIRILCQDPSVLAGPAWHGL